jgi:TonB family protein
MREVALAAILWALAAGGSATAAPALPLDVVVINPDWVNRPTASDMERFYPTFAAASFMSGKVVLQCSVAEAGSVQDCRVVAEAPMGLEFGLAAMRLAPLFKMRPRTIDGVAVSGGTVRIPITFSIGPRSGAGELNASVPDPRALALGLRLAEARGDRALYVRRWEPMGVSVRRSLDNPAMPGDIRQARTVIVTALETEAKAHADIYVRRRASNYARLFSEADLNALISFHESPAGKAWAAQIAEVDSETVFMRVVDDVREAASQAFCRQVSCELPGTAAANADRGPSLPIDGAR